MINIKFKVFSNEPITIEVDPTHSIRNYSDDVLKQLQLNVEDDYHLLFRGRLLDTDKSFDDYNIANDSTILVLSKQNKDNEEETSSSTTTSPTPTPQQNIIDSLMNFIRSGTTPQENVFTYVVPLNTTDFLNRQVNQNFGSRWDQMRNPADIINKNNLYNIEEIHALLIEMFPLLIQNAEQVERIRNDRNCIYEYLGTNEMRTNIRNILSNRINNIISNIRNR